MSAALRPDDAPDEAAGCAHLNVRRQWAKICPGTPDGASPDGEYVTQGAICPDCRLPVARTTERLDFGPWVAVRDACAVPARRRYPGPEARPRRRKG